MNWNSPCAEEVAALLSGDEARFLVGERHHVGRDRRRSSSAARRIVWTSRRGMRTRPKRSDSSRIAVAREGAGTDEPGSWPGPQARSSVRRAMRSSRAPEPPAAAHGPPRGRRTGAGSGRSGGTAGAPEPCAAAGPTALLRPTRPSGARRSRATGRNRSEADRSGAAPARRPQGEGSARARASAPRPGPARNVERAWRPCGAAGRSVMKPPATPPAIAGAARLFRSLWERASRGEVMTRIGQLNRNGSGACEDIFATLERPEPTMQKRSFRKPPSREGRTRGVSA